MLEKINDLKAQMLNPKNVEQTKLLLQSYIEKIVVDNNSIKVTFKVTFSFCYGVGTFEIRYNHTVVKSRKMLK